MDSEARFPRRLRTQAEVQQVVAEFLAGGMNQEEFCRSHELSRSTLSRYLQKRRNQERPELATQLVPVKLVDVRRKSVSGGTGLAVLLDNGRRIEVGASFDAGTLARLLVVMERA